MAEQQFKPVLQKPPGYRDPNTPVKPAPRPAPLKPVLRPPFHPRKKSRNCCLICCCWFTILVLVIILLLAILLGIFYIWFDPQLPGFHLESFKLSTFTVTTRPDGTYLNAVAVARVEVRNPNSKLKFRYGQSEVDLTAGDDGEVDLGSTNLPAFAQGKKNITSLKIETKVKDELLDDAVGSRLLAQFKNKELVVNVEVKTSVGFGVEETETGLLGVNILCEDVKLKQLEGGDMPKCSIRVLKWIKLQ